MDHDTVIIERLRAAADAIEVEPDLGRCTDPGLRPVGQHQPRSARRRLLVAAASVALLAAGIVGVVIVDRTGNESNPAAAPTDWGAPIPIPDGAPPAGSMAPHVVAAPSWVGELAPAVRDGALRSGHWVGAAIARPAEDGLTDPVLIAVFDGEYAPLAEASTIDVDGTALSSVQIGGWQAVATRTAPTLMVAGSVEEAELLEILDGTRITTDGTGFSVALDPLADGYVLVAAPRELGVDTTPRLTLASTEAGLAVNEVSDWIDPTLYAAGTGTDLTAQRVSGTDGWSGVTSGPAPVTFVVWSPQPGLLIEITTTDTGRPVGDLIELAERTTAIPVEDWYAAHPE